MWKPTKNRKLLLKRAIKFTRNHIEYGYWMKQVIKKWHYSCEHNLTDLSQNRRAWIGHAACALAFGCPEDIVREAWGYLTERQQELANKEADKAIEEWEKNYVKT